MSAQRLGNLEVWSTLREVSRQGSVAAAASALKIPRHLVAYRMSVARDRGITAEMDDPPADPAPTPRRQSATAATLPQTADECWRVLDAAIGRTRTARPGPKPRRAKFSDKRIVVASDFHAPFHHADAVAHMLAATQGFDQLIVNGDLQDSYSVSRFVKHESVPWEREIAAVDTLLSTFCEHFSDVLIVDGNHDRPRFEKLLRSLLPLDVIHAVEYLTQGEFSTIRALAQRRGHRAVRFAPIRVGRHNVAWCAQEGDLLVTHAEAYSRVPGSTLRRVEAWMSDLEDILDLQPWRVVVQGHTHAMGWFPMKARKVLVEGGCMCHVHGYQLDAKIAGTGQRLGFVTLTQRDGVTDLSSVRPHWIDTIVRAA